MDFLSWTHEIAQALLSLSSHHDKTINQCYDIHVHVKKVTRKTAERGDVVVALLSIQQIPHLPQDFNVVITELLSEECSPQKEELLKRLSVSLSTISYPVERCVVRKGVLCLWLQHEPVMRSVLLQALAASTGAVSSDSSQGLMSVEQALCDTKRVQQQLLIDRQETASTQEQSIDCFEPAPLPAHSLLTTPYGTNTLLKGQRVECYLPGDGDNSVKLGSSVHLNTDLTAYRGTLVARHLAALISMCGGTVVTRSGDDEKIEIACNVACGVKRSCDFDSALEADHYNPVSEASRTSLSEIPSACMSRLLVSWSPSCRGSTDNVAVGPVVAAHSKKKLRVDEGWDLDRCWKSIRTEMESASSHKQSTGQCEGSWPELVSRQAWCCLRLLLLGTQASSPLLLHTLEPANTRDAAFLLYNYSRVHTLLTRFVILERQGVVPPMPAPHLLEYSLLREQDEWELIWAIIQEWPDVLAGLALDIKRVVGLDENTQSRSKPDKSRGFPSHAVFLHLHDLCHRFSVYYNRIHILPAVGENSALPMHMLPVLYARIGLLLALKNTMDTSFHSLGVIPMKQM